MTVDISVRKVLHFVQSAGVLECVNKGLNERSEMVEVQGSLRCPALLYSTLLCSTLETFHKSWGIFFTLEVTSNFSRDLLYGISYSGKICLIKSNLNCNLSYKVYKRTSVIFQTKTVNVAQQVSLKQIW